MGGGRGGSKSLGSVVFRVSFVLRGEVVDGCLEGGSSDGVASLIVVVAFRLGFAFRWEVVVVDDCVGSGPSD